VAIEILTAEGYTPIEIHRRVEHLRDEDAIDVSSDSGSVVSRGHRLLVPQWPVSHGSDDGAQREI